MIRFVLAALVFVCVTLTPVLPVWAVSASDLEYQLSSKEGISRLLPSFRDKRGHFKVPDPTKDPQAFLTAQQTLTILIDQAESLALNRLSPNDLQRRLSETPTHLPPQWKRAEIAIRTDGRTQSCADEDMDCSAYGSGSFLNTLEPVEGLKQAFYTSVNNQGDAEALVYLQPTAVASVSRILLAASNSAGVWIPAAYALGPAGGDAFLIVNNCLDLAEANNGILKPAAMLVAALQWVE